MKRAAISSLLFAAGLSAATSASAVEVMFGFVGTTYYSYGQELAGYVDSLPGYNVTQRNLYSGVYSDIDSFDQVWVYDLSTSSDNSSTQSQNYTNIANWYNGLTDPNIVVDGRILSSSSYSSSGGTGSQNAQLMQNYATVIDSAIDSAGKGLVLGTDHDAFANRGMNDLASLVGIDPFTGNFFEYPYQAVVDPLSPLMADGAPIACIDASITEGCVMDHSSTSFVPTGDQPNGQFLTPAAYHGFISGAYDNAAIATSFGSETFGTCGGPGQPPCIVVDNGVPSPASLALMLLGLVGLAVGRRGRKES